MALPEIQTITRYADRAEQARAESPLVQQLFGPEAIVVPENPAEFLQTVGTYFETHQEKFITQENGRLGLTNEGRNFSRAVSNVLEVNHPEVRFDKLASLFQTNLNSSTETRLLRKSLNQRLEWEKKLFYYQNLVLEENKVENPLQAAICTVAGEEKTLTGAARFEHELKKVIKAREKELGQEVDITQEILAFQAALEEQSAELEKEIKAELAWRSLSFKEKIRQGWQSFKENVQEQGFLKASAPYLRKLTYATLSALSIGLAIAPGVVAVVQDLQKLADFPSDSQPDQSTPNPVKVSSPRVKHQSSQTNQAADQPDHQTPTANPTVEKPVTETHREKPVLPTPTLEPGQEVVLKAGGQEHHLTVTYGDEKPLNALIVQGYQPTAQPDGRVTVLGLHYGYVQNPDQAQGHYSPLPGTSARTSLDQSRPIGLTINGQAYQFVPAPVAPAVMSREAFQQDIYPQIESLAAQKGVFDLNGQPAVVLRTCSGEWLGKGVGFSHRTLWFGHLVPIDEQTS